MGDAQIRILDCTLRDGGYYNLWDFDHELVVDYLSAMSAAGVGLVEIGFRTPTPTSFVGAVGICAESFVNALEVPNNLEIGVMLNAKEILETDSVPNSVISSMFVERSQSKLSFVRFACGVDEYPQLEGVVEQLKSMGYAVGVNLMKVHDLDRGQLRSFGEWCQSRGADFCYFADSFGALEPLEVLEIVKILKSSGNHVVGCHLHDNKSLATANVFSAVEAGVDIVDSTVMGMGRGPGNARTEYVGPLLASKGSLSFELDPVLRLIDRWFSTLHERHKWGTNPFYLLSALKNVHPSYVQRLLGDSRLDSGSLVNSIHALGEEGGSSYSLDRAASVEIPKFEDGAGDWRPSEAIKSKQVLLLAAGQNLHGQRLYIENYLRQTNRPTTLNLNLTPVIDRDLIDYSVVLGRSRTKIDSTISAIAGPVISPYPDLFKSTSQSPMDSFTYGVAVESGSFLTNEFDCVIPAALTAAYALAIAVASGAEMIFLAGFDGFPNGDSRQVEMEQVFRCFFERFPNVQIVSLTPTSYRVRSTSVFALDQ